MMIAFERLCEYKKYLKHSLDKHIGLMYNKIWNFHVIFNKHSELSIKQQKGIMLNLLSDSWNYEKKGPYRTDEQVKL